MREIKRTGIKPVGSAGRGYMHALFECPACGKTVEKIAKDGRNAKTCSIECSRPLRGRKERRKESVIISGYRYIYSPNHPYGTKCYVAEHRLVLENKLGRYLKPEEVVHHINGDKLDNRTGNLIVLSNSDHHKLHAYMSTICRRGT